MSILAIFTIIVISFAIGLLIVEAIIVLYDRLMEKRNGKRIKTESPSINVLGVEDGKRKEDII